MRGRDRFSLGFGGFALGLAVLGVGSALRWVQAAVAILVAIALSFQLTSRRSLARLSPLVAFVIGALGLTALQLVPLPAAIVEHLQPSAVLRSDGVMLAGATTWPALTLDVAGSMRALTFFSILLGVAVLALRLASSERGRYACIAGVAAVCGLAALVTGIHRVFGLDSLYGIYEPAQATPPILGPLLNSNHLGGLMALGTVLSVGLLLYAKQDPLRRASWALCAGACMAVLFATLSRGAVLALLAGASVLLATFVAQRLASNRRSRTRQLKFLTHTLPLGIVIVCGLVVVVYSSAGNVAEQLANTSLQEIDEPRSKYAAWASATTLIDETPWVGVGRGAFEPAFTRVHAASAFVTFSHAENEYLQAIVEWGIPGAIVLAVLLGWIIVVTMRRWNDGPLAAGAMGAMACIAVQSNVDFGVELLAIAAPLTVIAATLTYVPLRERAPRIPGRTYAARLALLLGLTASASTLCLPITRTLAEDHQLLARDPDAAEKVLFRHPLDYYAYAVVAHRRIAAMDERGVRLLNHAMELHPTHPGLHLMAARLLRRDHPSQAAVEYAAALRGTLDPSRILREVTSAFPPDGAAAAIPTDYSNVDVIVRALVQLERQDVAIRWLERVMVNRPDELLAIELLYNLAKQGGNLEMAEAAARRKVTLVPDSEARLALAEILAKRGAYADVVEQISDVSQWGGRVEEISRAWLLLCDAHMKLEAWHDAIHCLHTLDVAAIVPDKHRDEITKRIEAATKGRAASLRKLELFQTPSDPATP